MSYFQMLRSAQNDALEPPAVSAAWAFAALALLLLWQFLTVHYNRSGNWTALFLTGRTYEMPPQLVAGTYRFSGAGYDGEMYRYVAHDLLMQHGYARYMDGPAPRYRRLLVPALAFLLAGGREAWIDAAYIAVIALFVFAGAYWLSRWAVLMGAHPAWALGFLLVPATLISMDRMTVDVALAAFTVAFAVYWRTGAGWKLFVTLLLACLVRETALLLVAGVSLFELLHRRLPRALLWASSALPMFAWYFFLGRIFHAKTRFGAPVWFANKLGPGLFYHLLRPPRYPLPPALETVARFADALTLAAILLASILAILLVLRNRPIAPLTISGLLFAALVFALTARAYWIDVNGYARVLSPLLIWVALPAIARETRHAFPWWLALVPSIVVDLRLALQFTSQIQGVLRGLLRLG
jgi:hypothetical protein